jgi:hypothetical protein
LIVMFLVGILCIIRALMHWCEYGGGVSRRTFPVNQSFAGRKPAIITAQAALLKLMVSSWIAFVLSKMDQIAQEGHAHTAVTVSTHAPVFCRRVLTCPRCGRPSSASSWSHSCSRSATSASSLGAQRHVHMVGRQAVERAPIVTRARQHAGRVLQHESKGALRQLSTAHCQSHGPRPGSNDNKDAVLLCAFLSGLPAQWKGLPRHHRKHSRRPLAPTAAAAPAYRRPPCGSAPPAAPASTPAARSRRPGPRRAPAARPPRTRRGAPPPAACAWVAGVRGPLGA